MKNIIITLLLLGLLTFCMACQKESTITIENEIPDITVPQDTAIGFFTFGTVTTNIIKASASVIEILPVNNEYSHSFVFTSYEEVEYPLNSIGWNLTDVSVITAGTYQAESLQSIAQSYIDALAQWEADGSDPTNEPPFQGIFYDTQNLEVIFSNVTTETVDISFSGIIIDASFEEIPVSGELLEVEIFQ